MKLSQFKVGDWVVVRSKEEILRTLDSKGQLDGMPFMPTMLKFCGKRFRVLKSAHKGCDTINNTGIRTIDSSVHLDELRCDGSSYGGCQAGCLLYWRDEWLLPADEVRPVAVDVTKTSDGVAGCNEEQLYSSTRAQDGTSDEVRYICQATQHPVYSRHLPASDWRQYLADCSTGNTKKREMVEPIFFLIYNNIINSGLGFGTPLRWIYSAVQKLRGQTPYPWERAKIPKGGRTPSAKLDLQPGEWARVKKYEEILETLDEDYKNRGMAFHAELAYYCGGTFQVVQRIERIINEQTGRMMNFKNECLVLKGTDCIGRFSKPLFCPRGGFTYWREIWLERVPAPDSSPISGPCPSAGARLAAATAGVSK
jgi:hypothetical protein